MRKITTFCLCLMLIASSVLMVMDAEVGTVARGGVAYTVSEPFRINSNADFATSPKVTGGDGSVDNPWIIEKYDINGTGYGYCIYIGNTTEYFVVKDCNLHEASGKNYWTTYYWNSGLALFNVQNGTIANNNASSNEYGIFLVSSSGNTIVDNANTNNPIGISLWSSSGNTISNNDAPNNWYGISLSSSSGNTIANNDAPNNWYGISLRDSIGNIIFNNDASSNEYGIILIFSSNNNNISNNDASSNEHGIALSSSNSNTIANNNANSNNKYGIHLWDSSDNTIYHNNFISNTVQAYDEGVNIWHSGYPSGGNYWSDYTGIDEYSGPNQDIPGSDGIGDTSYTNIDGDAGVQDDYPLMKPYVDDTGSFLWIILILVAATIIGLLAFLFMRKDGKPDTPKPEEVATEKPVEKEFTNGQSTEPPKNE